MKPVVNYIKQDHSPTKSAWVVGLGGTVLILFGLIYVDRALDTHYMISLHEDLQSSLASNPDWHSVMEEPRFGELVRTDTGDLKRGVQSIVSVSSLINQENFKKARFQVDKVTFPTPRKSDNDELLEFLDEALDAKRAVKSGTGKEIDLAQTKSRLETEYKDISNDLSAVFAKSTILIPSELKFEKNGLEVYKSGMLKGFPVMEGLPKTIANEAAFSELMDGTYVKATKTYLDKLGKRSTILRKDLNQYVEASSRAEEGQISSSEKLENLRKNVDPKLIQLIAQKSKPHLSDSENAARNNFIGLVEFVKEKVTTLI